MSREQTIERERRWARPAAIAGILALVLAIAANLISGAITSADTAAERQVEFQDNTGALLATSVLGALGIALLSVPLLYLFRAAQARNPRMQGALVGFVVLGPVCLGIQFLLGWFATDDVSQAFIDRSPIREVAYADFEGQVKQSPERIEEVTIYPDSQVAEVEYQDGSFADVDYASADEEVTESDLEKTLDDAGVDNDQESDGDPGDALIQKLTEDSSVNSVGIFFSFAGTLAMAVAMVYTGLNAVRTGLLTRFFGTLGIALGGSILLLGGLALFVLLFWFGWLGLTILGRVPGGRPPAWDAGEAIPWPAPGEGPPDQPLPPDTIEGSGTEVMGGDATQGAPRQRGERRKRKRRG